MSEPQVQGAAKLPQNLTLTQGDDVSDLVDFLLARITEEQLWAEREAKFCDCDLPGFPLVHGVRCGVRIVAECAAKRRIIEIHRFDEGGSDPCDAHDPDYRSIDCDTLLALAQPYAAHPDYDESWSVL